MGNELGVCGGRVLTAGFRGWARALGHGWFRPRKVFAVPVGGLPRLLVRRRRGGVTRHSGFLCQRGLATAGGPVSASATREGDPPLVLGASAHREGDQGLEIRAAIVVVVRLSGRYDCSHKHITRIRTTRKGNARTRSPRSFQRIARCHCMQKPHPHCFG